MQNGQNKALRQVIHSLTARGVKVELVPTSKPNEASELARNAVTSGYDLVIACGGDGTINEVICGMAKSNVPLMIIPAGTANVLARELGIPRNLLKSAELAQSGEVRRISLGRADSRYFVCMAGVGVDAAIIDVVNNNLKRRIGEGAFWLAGFRQLFGYRFTQFKLVIDGHNYQATFAVISRVKNYGGPFQITPQADLFADLFDVCLFQSANRWRYLYYLGRVAARSHLSLPDVVYLKARVVEVLGASGVGVQVDGELIGTLPQEIVIEKDALSLVVPRDRVIR